MLYQLVRDTHHMFWHCGKAHVALAVTNCFFSVVWQSGCSHSYRLFMSIVSTAVWLSEKGVYKVHTFFYDTHHIHGRDALLHPSPPSLFPPTLNISHPFTLHSTAP